MNSYLRKKNLMLILVIVAITLSFVGCSNNGGNDNDSPDVPDVPDVADSTGANTEKKSYNLASASLGGTYYIVGSGVAEAITKNVDNLTVNNINAQGSTGNPLMIKNGEVELAMTNYYSGYNALNAKAIYKEKIDIAGICPLQYSIIQFFTFADRDDINTIADLKGKKVAIGPAGGGGALIYKEILPYWGITADDTIPSYVSYSDGSEALQDKKIDMNVPHGAPPLEAISSVAFLNDIKIINMESDKLAEITKDFPYYEAATIPGGTYEGLDEDIQSVGIRDILVVSADMDEEEAYKITKAIYESIEKLKEIHPSLKEMSFDNYKHSLVPLHPGALRFYEENNIPLS